MLAWRCELGGLGWFAGGRLRARQRGVGHRGGYECCTSGCAVDSSDWNDHHRDCDFGAVAANPDGGESLNDFTVERLFVKAADPVANFEGQQNLEGAADDLGVRISVDLSCRRIHRGDNAGRVDAVHAVRNRVHYTRHQLIRGFPLFAIEGGTNYRDNIFEAVGLE